MRDQSSALKAIRDDPKDFVAFWSGQYYAEYTRGEAAKKRQQKYELLIGRRLTRESVLDLYEWKNGGKIAKKKMESIEKFYLPRVGRSDQLPSDWEAWINGCGSGNGGPIWHIFWLHCCKHTEYPIFDQHVERAMQFFRQSCTSHQSKTKKKIIQAYHEYRKFNQPFKQSLVNGERAGIKADQALWSFGKFIKTWRQVRIMLAWCAERGIAPP